MVTWTITEDKADRILNALMQRPYIEVNALIVELVQQANQQQVEQRRAQAQQQKTETGLHVVDHLPDLMDASDSR